MDLIGNYLTGPIPSELGNLVKLKKLSLTHMRLYCAIPNALGNLINVEELDLSEAKLTDSIPASLGNLINLAKLSLQHNELSGAVPDMFGGMTKLQSLALDYNHLEGPIPQSISLCTQLTTTVGVPEIRLAPPGLLHGKWLLDPTGIPATLQAARSIQRSIPATRFQYGTICPCR
ncbi:hypothetical protein HDU77_010076 [Chytriomyces hyalinus]|nr:hypothetical protein HDU77_010076 [Chytriomyces hyalinus]